MDSWRRKVRGGVFFFVCFYLLCLGTFPNVLSLNFFCRNAPWRRNGLLETKGKGEGSFFSFFFRLFCLGTFSNVLSLNLFCRNALWRRNGLLETKGKGEGSFFS